MSPGEFVPIAEKNLRLSRLLMDWSLRAVCELAQHWPLQAGESPLRISINIPAGQFYQKGFVDWVITTLKENGLSHERLTLELTEVSLLADVDKAIQTMRDLQDHILGSSHFAGKGDTVLQGKVRRVAFSNGPPC